MQAPVTLQPQRASTFLLGLLVKWWECPFFILLLENWVEKEGKGSLTPLQSDWGVKCTRRISFQFQHCFSSRFFFHRRFNTFFTVYVHPNISLFIRRMSNTIILFLWKTTASSTPHYLIPNNNKKALLGNFSLRHSICIPRGENFNVPFPTKTPHFIL